MAATPRTPLPQAVLARPKTGFAVPIADWLGNGCERGHRGWARQVHARLWQGETVTP